jgi:hypothetical protein
MKKLSCLLVAALFTAGFSGTVSAAPKTLKKSTTAPAAASKAEDTSAKKAGFQPFPVFTDQGARTNHFAPSGWMGDYGDVKINPGAVENPHSGKTSIKITYSGKMTQNAGWAGMYWQQPANNWGDKKGGFNLTGATKLTFWARGAKGGEKISEFKMGGITGEYPDSDSAAIGPVELTPEWQKYTVELKDKDLSHVIGGFCWSASKDDNPDGFVVYVDDIMYE